MARQAGYYEWDDDLTPGKKKEGGWHQNLYDFDGRLKGNARFIPKDDVDDEPIVVTKTTYIPAEKRRLSKEEEEFAEAIADLTLILLSRGAKAIKPHAKRLWRDKVKPIAKSQSESLKTRLHSAQLKIHEFRTSTGECTPPIQPPRDQSADNAVSTKRLLMSSAEAKARLLAAAAARAYSDEQQRIVEGSQIVDAVDLETIRSSLALLPHDEISGIIEDMARNPRLLEESSLADLASLLGRRHQIDEMSNERY
ncbi:hypothetical protein [Actinomyces naeslundii]|uniref:hypothetical protein n=1 Tax=Actinomyces naeslundii TaxID=1655 RepID=UPI00094D8217|nr:hypothetical protein [Actinomyces naeslundii]OLO83636.1 hypothetical protein BKH12_07800 [Actinomyces naeslundii]